MGISAVAEGVETKDQAAELNMLGCPVGQGFYFSQPLPAEEFGESLIRYFAWSADRPAALINKDAKTWRVVTASRGAGFSRRSCSGS